MIQTICGQHHILDLDDQFCVHAPSTSRLARPSAPNTQNRTADLLATEHDRLCASRANVPPVLSSEISSKARAITICCSVFDMRIPSIG